MIFLISELSLGSGRDLLSASMLMLMSPSSQRWSVSGCGTPACPQPEHWTQGPYPLL